MNRKKSVKILGIDPGIASTGYGLINKDLNKISLIIYGCISTSPNEPFPQRLEKIYQELKKIIQRHRPSTIAVEEIFFYKNVKTALNVGQTRGTILLLANQMKIPLEEFTPLEIKQAITSYGRANKNQVQQMIKTILNLKEIPRPDDAADALACALCCAFFHKF